MSLAMQHDAVRSRCVLPAACDVASRHCPTCGARCGRPRLCSWDRVCRSHPAALAHRSPGGARHGLAHAVPGWPHGRFLTTLPAQHPPPTDPLRPLPPCPHAVLSPPVVAAWPDGHRRSTYHDIKWHEAAGLLYAAGACCVFCACVRWLASTSCWSVQRGSSSVFPPSIHRVRDCLRQLHAAAAADRPRVLRSLSGGCCWTNEHCTPFSPAFPFLHPSSIQAGKDKSVDMYTLP